MPDLDVTEELQTFLVAQAVGLNPAAGNGTTPTIWVNPKDGAPTPRPGKDTATVTLRATHIGIPSPMDADMEETFVDVTVRTTLEVPGIFLQRQIRGVLVPTNAVGGAKMVMVGALLCEYITQWRADQALPVENQTYVRRQSFRFAARRKALQGLPYTP